MGSRLGPGFLEDQRVCSLPNLAWLNGHSWAQRQLDKAGIEYEALDNGFRWCADPAALQRICNRLGPSAVHTFFWRWFHRLPSPFAADDLQAGYTYELAFRQFEVSDTRVFDRPQTGRAFFEGVIRDHLDVGRPDQVVLIFDRKLMPRTPGRFRTRVVTRGVNPQLYCTYKSSRLKQDCENRAGDRQCRDALLLDLSARRQRPEGSRDAGLIRSLSASRA